MPAKKSLSIKLSAGKPIPRLTAKKRMVPPSNAAVANGSDGIEEQYEGAPTGVEVETTDDEATDSESEQKPWDPSLIRVDPKSYSLRNIIDFIEEGDLELAPDFQRNRVWKGRQKSRLIESILLRIPVPAFYFSADAQGRMKVVDGLQRLSTIYAFVMGKKDNKDIKKDSGFALAELEYLTHLHGERFSSLDAQWTRRIYSTQIFVNVIDPQTPAAVKFDIFKRINTGGSPLNSQEIRHCISSDRSRNFLKENAEHPLFRAATGDVLHQHIRMADREVVLRFCAFRLLGDINKYAPKTQIDEFLTQTTGQLDEVLTDVQLGRLRDDFRRAMGNADRLFGQHAFRKWAEDSKHLAPLNKALFDSWSVALADYTWEELEPHAPVIVADARRLMSEDTYYNLSITYGTGDHLRVKKRFQAASQILANNTRKRPRRATT